MRAKDHGAILDQEDGDFDSQNVAFWDEIPVFTACTSVGVPMCRPDLTWSIRRPVKAISASNPMCKT